MLRILEDHTAWHAGGTAYSECIEYSRSKIGEFGICQPHRTICQEHAGHKLRRDAVVADPRVASVPMERLISKKYADERRALMDPARALP